MLSFKARGLLRQTRDLPDFLTAAQVIRASRKEADGEGSEEEAEEDEEELEQAVVQEETVKW